MNNRRFGIELEFNSNGIGRDGIRNLLRRNNVPRNWWSPPEAIGYDGSEIELRSPILQGRYGFNQLKKVANLLVDNGCTVGRADGMHVHHDAPEFYTRQRDTTTYYSNREIRVPNKELVVKLLKAWKNNEEYIAQFIDSERARISWQRSGPCPTIYDNQIEDYNSNGDVEGAFGYRHNLNLRAIREHGSIELRFHEGCLDWDQMEAWIRFGQKFIDGVLARKLPLKKANDPLILMNRIKATKRTRITLANKAGIALV